MSAHAGHGTHSAHVAASLNRSAVLATLHGLTGCATGEGLGMVIGPGTRLLERARRLTRLLLGCSLTMLPLLGAGLAVAVAAHVDAHPNATATANQGAPAPPPLTEGA